MNNPAPRFCSNCGKPLHTGARFCGICGAQIPAAPAQPAAAPAGFSPPVLVASQLAPAASQPAPAASQPAPAASQPASVSFPLPVSQPGPVGQPEEPIIQTITSLIRRKGLFGREPFLLLVTARRLVFAAITAEQQKWAAEQAKENARQQGKGFLKQWGAVINSLSFLVDTYRAMPVSQILTHHPDNFFIDLGQIQQVKTKVNWDMDDANTPDEVEIRYSGGKMKFELAGCSARDVKNVLKPLLGSRVK